MAALTRAAVLALKPLEGICHLGITGFAAKVRLKLRYSGRMVSPVKMIPVRAAGWSHGASLLPMTVTGAMPTVAGNWHVGGAVVMCGLPASSVFRATAQLDSWIKLDELLGGNCRLFSTRWLHWYFNTVTE